MHEFTPWPKTARLFRDITVTEKIDGTNAAIHISPSYEVAVPSLFELKPGEAIVDGRLWRLSAQSRRRLITPDADNFGFARWVYDNAAELVRLLGEGLHYGEWWGHGIQRGYGRDSRSFSLFNTARYDHLNHDDAAMFGDSRVNTVPVLYEGTFDQDRITGALSMLGKYGSIAAPGMAAEGICVYHSALGRVAKVTLDHNDAGKWEA